MVTVVDAVGLVGLLLVNAAVVALMTRFFRVRLDTRWASFVYVLVLCPFVLVVVVLFVSGVLGLGPDLGSTGAVVVVTVALPLAAGVTFDYFWMPSPEEVDLPEQWEREDRSRYDR
jgi:apolipoprotein N-acyltransferase